MADTKKTVITNTMAKEMKTLRDLGVPLMRIARKFGVHDDTVRRHTSDADRDKIAADEKRRYEKAKQNPAIVERRRQRARELYLLKKAQRQAERSGL